ncbi:MAG: hypothetical protein N2109_02205 [Fimbriimonadales bacterium]|nr:hypothetical protein [Fimbriimonadales bacterium]
MMLASIAATVLLTPSLETPIPVRVVRENGLWSLRRGGERYFVRGVGGSFSLPLAKAQGANSVRTWGADNQLALLDQAHRLGLTVTVGIWLGHRQHGFDYADEAQVKEQLQRAERDVLRYRNHPALLMWGLGNEMEVGADSELVWKAVGDIARMVKRLDPNHPTMTVVAEIDEAKIRAIQRLAPDIDVLGINSYGGIRSLPERLHKAGWTKPYIVTEFGPRGPWESPKASYGAAFEDDSTAKARDYAEGYRLAVASQRGWALGSYAFLWGHKPEGTPTWFGMVLPSGEMLGAVDAMTEAWTGKPAANRAPRISQARCSKAGAVLKPGDPIEASVQTADPDGDKLAYRWFVLVDDPNAKFDEPVPTEAELSSGPSVRLAAPRDLRNYRLYLVVRDGKGKAATANWPFSVRP